MTQLLLTPAQVASALKVDESWVYRHKDEIGYLRIGPRLIRFTEKKVDDYLEKLSGQWEMVS